MTARDDTIHTCSDWVTEKDLMAVEKAEANVLVRQEGECVGDATRFF